MLRLKACASIPGINYLLKQIIVEIILIIDISCIEGLYFIYQNKKGKKAINQQEFIYLEVHNLHKFFYSRFINVDNLVKIIHNIES